MTTRVGAMPRPIPFMQTNTESSSPFTAASAAPPATAAATPRTSRTAMAMALAVWLGLCAGGLALWQATPHTAPVPLHSLRVERGSAPPAPSEQAVAAPATPPAPVPHAVLPLPDDPAISAAICAPWLQRWAALAPTLCLSAQLAPSGAQSVQGLPLAWRDVAPAQAEHAAAAQRVLVVGAIHGDELTAAALALHWVALAEQVSARQAVHWRFIPVLNPDGFLARPATRTNASGVDLNRNFPTPNWAEESVQYWEKRTRRDPRRWPGPAALSEPESQFLHRQMAEFAPDLVVSIHAPYGVLDFDGPQTPPSKLGMLQLSQLGVFPGSVGNYGGLQQGVPVVTIELHHALRMPQRREVDAMWQDLLGWMGKHLPHKASNQ